MINPFTQVKCEHCNKVGNKKDMVSEVHDFEGDIDTIYWHVKCHMKICVSQYIKIPKRRKK